MGTERDGNPSEENPFENIPSDLAFSQPAPPPPPAHGAPPPVKKTTPAPKPRSRTPPANRNPFALASGLGFILIAIILYFFLTRNPDTTTYIITFLSLLFPAIIALFYLLDDLTIRPLSMSGRSAHFVSGIFWGALVFLIIIILGTYSDWLYTTPLFMLMILMNLSTALFLYAMFWEE